MIDKIREPVSCLTHLAGAFIALALTAGLLVKSVPYGSVYIISFAIFGTSMILLYMASAVYHMLRVGEKTLRILRRIDHTMIFVLIAGTYTPVCLLPLRGAWGISILSVIWSLALIGVFMKVFWLQAPRWLSTAIYILMGWLVVVAFYPLWHSVSGLAFALLCLGGVSYTLGALIYAMKWPDPYPNRFGFHEIFHIFVLLGTAFHVLFMFQLFPD